MVLFKPTSADPLYEILPPMAKMPESFVGRPYEYGPAFTKSYPSIVQNKFPEEQVLYINFPIFKACYKQSATNLRNVIKEALERLSLNWPIKIQAPLSIECNFSR